MARHRARQSHALSLSARKLTGKLVGEFLQTKDCQRINRTFVSFAAFAKHEQWQSDILSNTKKRDEAGRLEGDRNLARPEAGSPAEGRPGKVAACGSINPR